MTIGTRFNVGIDPQNLTANVTLSDGLNVIDVSRENSSWSVVVDSKAGISLDSGKITGIQEIRRELGPQITGYLVDLSKNNPELALEYVKAVRYYWKYRSEKK